MRHAQPDRRRSARPRKALLIVALSAVIVVLSASLSAVRAEALPPVPPTPTPTYTPLPFLYGTVVKEQGTNQLWYIDAAATRRTLSSWYWTNCMGSPVPTIGTTTQLARYRIAYPGISGPPCLS